MARLSPITIGLSVVTIGVVALAIFLFARPRHAAPERAAADPVEEQEPATPPAALPPPPLPPPARAAPIAGAPEAPAPSPTAIDEVPGSPGPGSIDGPAPAEDNQAPPAPRSRRALLFVNHNRRMGEADEQLFATLNLPDATRASIRQINDEYRKRTELGPDRPAGPEVAESTAAVQARQDSLRLLLGAGPAKDFDTAERIAIQRLRGKYRFEWGRQLRQ